MDRTIVAVLCGGCLVLAGAAGAMVAAWPGNAEAIVFGMIGTMYLWFICHGIAAMVMLIDKN